MPENDRTIERIILIDEPSKEDLFHGKGHEKTANALAKAIEEFKDKDRSIGIDGPWGSGKSSIVEMAERKLNTSNERNLANYHFFTFDIWKSQGSAFRRSFLEHLLSWSIKNFPNKQQNLKEIEKNVKGKTRIIDTNNRPVLDLYGVIFLLLVPFLPLYYFWAKSVFDDDKRGAHFFLSTPLMVLYAFLFFTFARAFISWLNEKPNISFLEAMSKTLLISTKKYEDHTIKQQIREIDPNDFEFEDTLRSILEIVQNENNKIVFILDNIDRLPSDEIDEYWALVRSVFSRNSNVIENNKRVLTAIVPYDRNHILSNDDKVDDGIEKPKVNMSPLSSQEIFSKTFDEVLSVSPPVMSNSKEFFENKISYALPYFKNKEVLFRVYLIFNTILKVDNGHVTPRQIIFFINELTGLYALHDGRFELTTLAIYLAYKDIIENNSAVLTDPKFISEKLRNLSQDSELERKLAAIAYNIDEDLAFQVLLDQRIVSASQDKDFEVLKSLSAAHGFDIRVNEVIQDATPEWVRTKDLGQVIINFSELSKNYEGSAKKYFFKNLMESLSYVDVIDIHENEYKKYFGLFDLGNSKDLEFISDRLITLVYKSIDKAEAKTYELGESWGNFVNEVNAELIKFDDEEHIKAPLKKLNIPSDFEFMFGLGRASEISLRSYQNLTISENEGNIGSYETNIIRFVIGYPERSKYALKQFHQVSLFNSNTWIALSNVLIKELSSEECSEEDFPNLLEILGDVWNYIPNYRDEIDLKSLYYQAVFYEGLSANDNESVVPIAVFLALQLYPDCTIPIPQTIDPTSYFEVDCETDDFIWFRDVISGEKKLTKDQIKVISEKTKCPLTMPNLIVSGNKIKNSLINSIVISAFSSENVPRIKLFVLMENYSYMSSLFENNFSEILSKYGMTITKIELSDVEIEDCPIKIINDTFALAEWSEFHKHIEAKLNSIDAEEWSKNIVDGNHKIKVLLEKSKLSKFIMRDIKFREMLERCLINILDGNLDFEESDIEYDGVVNVVDKKYHPDLYRKIREGLSNVTAGSLFFASDNFSILLNNLVDTPNDVSAKERDNIIRHLLCVALESNNQTVLRSFLSVGKKKLSSSIKLSQESTKEKVTASLETFGDLNEDRNFGRSIAELLGDKKKANTWFDIWFPPKNDETVEDKAIDD